MFVILNLILRVRGRRNIHRDAGGSEAAQIRWSQLVRTLKIGQGT